jgi:hypothetical protein
MADIGSSGRFAPASAVGSVERESWNGYWAMLTDTDQWNTAMVERCWS